MPLSKSTSSYTLSNNKVDDKKIVTGGYSLSLP